MNKEIREQSILYKDVPIAKSGIYKYLGEELGVQPYHKVFNVLRHPDDYTQEFLDSLTLVPLLDDHHDGKIGASNNKIGAIGGNAWKDSEGKIRTDIAIFDIEAEEKIKLGKKELSIGFLSDILAEDGVYNGQQYQFRQIPRKAEHVALVHSGRAGKDVKLHDSEKKGLLFFDSFEFNEDEKMGETNSPTMSDILTAIEGLVSRVSALESQKSTQDDGESMSGGADLNVVDPQKVGEEVAKEIVSNVPEAVEAVVESMLGQNINIPEEEKQVIETAVESVSGDIQEAVSSAVENMQTETPETISDEGKKIDSQSMQDAAIKKFRYEEKQKEAIFQNMKDCGFEFSLSAGESLAETSERARSKFCADTKANIAKGDDMSKILTGYRIHYRQSEASKTIVHDRKPDVKESKNSASNGFFEVI